MNSARLILPPEGAVNKKIRFVGSPMESILGKNIIKDQSEKLILHQERY